MTDMILRDDIELEPKPLGIGGKKLEILCVKDLEPLIANLTQKERAGDQEDGIEKFPFWVKIWEASIVLTDRLVHMGIDTDQKILEVGAGMGITGLFMGAFGHRVTITDFNDDALALLERNAAHNGVETVQIAKLDWHAPGLDETFDIICGSELIYKESDVAPVIGILKQYLAPGGTVYLAHDIQRMSMIHFLKGAEKDFDISHKGMSFTGKDRKKQIVIHTMKRKASG